MKRIATAAVAMAIVFGGATTGALAAPESSLAAATPRPSASAAPALTWAVRPADGAGPDGRRWVDASVEPGTSHADRLAVSNFSREAVVFTLAAADGYFTKAGSFTLKRPDEENTGAGTWIAFDQPTVRVEAGATVVVPFTVTVPANATPGDHAAGVAAGMVIAGTDVSGSAVGVNSRVGFRVMLHVAGEARADVAARDVEASYDLSWNPFRAGTVRVTGVAENAGNTLVHLSGSVETAGHSTQTGNRDLLPGERASLASTVGGVWPLGPVEVVVTVHGTPADDGIAAVVHRETVTVWAVPLPQLIVLSALVGIVLGALALRRRNRMHWEARIAAAREEGVAAAPHVDKDAT